jgi:tetratricopeptide (TPR) repeat protein
MHERLRRSNELLAKALALDEKPIEALSELASNYHMVGNDEAAEQYLRQAEAIKPQYLAVHDTRLNFSLPQWGGSDEQVKAAFERAKAAGLDQDSQLNLEDIYIARPGKMTNPGAARAYWEKVIREHPTRRRLSSLLKDFMWMENWKDALPVADRLIAEYPDETDAYYQRARANEHLGRIPEAWNDYLMAAAMGHELALQELISAHIRGGLGVTERSSDAVVEFCRYGATLGHGVGANCIGSLFFEGESAGIKFRRDPAQALAWHLVGARGGHYNSQYDLGWLLFTGRGGSVEPDAARRLGIFWMRRAAEQGHHFAKRKLEENKIELSEEPATKNEWDLNVGSVLSTLYALIQIWI